MRGTGEISEAADCWGIAHIVAVVKCQRIFPAPFIHSYYIYILFRPSFYGLSRLLSLWPLFVRSFLTFLWLFY